MQYPIDGLYRNVTITGVPVLLTALDSSNNPTVLGTVTTNPYYGTFSFSWTPPKEDTYSIIVSFAGDESYGSSSAGTSLSVGAAPTSSTPSQPQTEVPDYSMLLYGILVAVIVAIIIGLVAIALVLRKR